MAEHRERVDKRVSRQVIRRVIVPLALDLGARYLRTPRLGAYDDEEKTLSWGLGYKNTHDTRMKTSVKFEGIHYRDGEKIEGKTHEIETDRRIGWSRRHDNRLAQNDETVNVKLVSFEETFNKLRTFTSFDLVQSFSATGQGEIMGIGGSVSSNTTASAHTEIETEKFNTHREERIIDDSVRLCYPGPLYRTDLDNNGVAVGRTLVEEGPIWLIERPVVTLHTVTPITQWGIWDARIVLDIENWAGNYGPMPRGKHWNVLKFSGLDELISFMHGDLVLRHQWSTNLKLSDESKRGLEWLEDSEKRRVGPVEWDRIRVNENVGSLEPSIIDPDE